MDKEAIIEQVVQKAYNSLINVMESEAYIMGGYLGIIIPEKEINNLGNYIDEIINKLFIKFCEELSNKIIEDDIEFINYKSFCFNKPSDKLIKWCFEFVNDNLSNKKSSKATNLLESLNSLVQEYPEEDVRKSLDTIFDILLDYCSIKK